MYEKDIDDVFKEIVKEYYKEIEVEAAKIGVATLYWKKDIATRLIKKLEKHITTHFNSLFTDAVVRSNIIVKNEVAALANTIDLPVKYDRALLDTFNTDKSIFTGFYDNQYKQEFTKREIYRLKSQILKGKYSNYTEKEMVKSIQKTVKVSSQRALVIARQETARLNTAAQSIYYNNTKVKNKYNKVWNAINDSAVRPDHLWMDGQVADTDGWFITKDGNKTQGPPLDFGCRCHIELISK